MEKKLWNTANHADQGTMESSNVMKDLLGSERDFSFAYRLACEEGPWHHAYANAILLNGLMKGIGDIAKRLSFSITPYGGEVFEVPMHRPLHHHLSGNGIYPADLPVNLILLLAEGDEQRAKEMIDALTEGAPHHVMANIITMHLAEAVLSLAMKIKTDDTTGA